MVSSISVRRSDVMEKASQWPTRADGGLGSELELVVVPMLF
jgi:hypothetical protein